MTDRPDWERKNDVTVRSADDLASDITVHDSVLQPGESETVVYQPDEGFIWDIVDFYFDVAAPAGTGGHLFTLFSVDVFRGRTIFGQSDATEGLEFNFGRWINANTEAQPPATGSTSAYQRISNLKIEHADPLHARYFYDTDLAAAPTRTYSIKYQKRQIEPGV